ncbi:NAD(P)-binding protein [Micromonospora sp. DT46]|uniref:NAD(P)-binding protein n=1 Tax=Micromonospora sp. DT46 TaxID=3393435 RepID=UPI003CF8624F
MLDVAVIGSGLSGSAIAAELEGSGLDYRVLEAGPDLGHVHIGATRETWALEAPDGDPCFEPFLPAHPGWYGRGSGYRARVGGRGLYWRGISLRLEDSALVDWPAPVRAALIGDETREGDYARAERDIQTWMGGLAMSAPRTATEVTLSEQLTVAGFPAHPTPRAIRVRQDGGWEAYSPLHLVPSARILAGHRATTVFPLSSVGYRINVRTPHGPEVVEAEQVVLCAGAFRNAELVDDMLRRVPGAAPSSRYPLLDHVATGLVSVDRRRRPEHVDTSVYAGHHPHLASNLFVEQQAVDDDVLWDLWAMGEQAAEAASTLSVGEGARVVLDADAQSTLDELTHGHRKLLDAAAEALGLTAIASEEIVDFDAAVRRARDNPGVGFRYRATLGELDHECGCLPLDGPIVDTIGQLKAFPGAFVGGPSLFPRAGAANPSLTTLALAKYLAAQLIRRAGVSSASTAR